MRPSAFRSDSAVTPTTSDTNTSGTTIIFSAATNTEPATSSKPSISSIWTQGAVPIRFTITPSTMPESIAITIWRVRRWGSGTAMAAGDGSQHAVSLTGGRDKADAKRVAMLC